MNKLNLAILVGSQCLATTGSIVMVTLAGIIGASLSSNPAWATLPVSIMVVAVAATTVPATFTMRRIGRRGGFMFASLTAFVAVLLAVVSLRQQSFLLFTVSLAVFGINLAFAQQYRFAAAESVPRERVARAVSLVLTGSIGGAVLGPELAKRGEHWMASVPYAGTLLALAALYVLQILLLSQLRQTAVADSEEPTEVGEGSASLWMRPVFVVAVLGGTIGYGLMTLIMTATPISMHVRDGMTLAVTADVIRAHVLGMYVPSLFSGFLIERFGVIRLMLAGVGCLLATAIIGMQGQSVMHYGWALLLLGVGWNFLYVGGTTLLSYSHSRDERYRAQAINEFSVFGVSALASLLAGTVMHYLGWLALMWVPLPPLLLMLAALYAIRHRPQVRGRLTG